MGGTLATRAGQGRGGGCRGGAVMVVVARSAALSVTLKEPLVPPPPCCGQSPATGLEQRQEAGMTLQLGFPSCLKRVLQNAHPTF